MKPEEIENACAESPPAYVIEELSSHNLSVPRGLDRRWVFMGHVVQGRLDWFVPCKCKPYGPKIHCGRFVSSQWTEAYFVGVCTCCGAVLWLQEDEKLKEGRRS